MSAEKELFHKWAAKTEGDLQAAGLHSIVVTMPALAVVAFRKV